MSHIKPLPLNGLDTDLQHSIQRNIKARVLSTDFQVRVWAHKPDAALDWLKLLETLIVNSSLPERLREIVRLKIASITNCSACKIARKSDTVTDADLACLGSDDPRFTKAEQAALRYAELFATDFDMIGDGEFDELKAHFSQAQIVDLNMFVAMMFAGGRMTFVQKAYADQENSAPVKER